MILEDFEEAVSIEGAKKSPWWHAAANLTQEWEKNQNVSPVHPKPPQQCTKSGHNRANLTMVTQETHRQHRDSGAHQTDSTETQPDIGWLNASTETYANLPQKETMIHQTNQGVEGPPHHELKDNHRK